MAVDRPAPLRLTGPHYLKLAGNAFQWPLTGLHLCDSLRLSAMGLDALLKFQWPLTGLHLCDEPELPDEDIVVNLGKMFQWPLTGLHLCDGRSLPLNLNIQTSFQWPLTGLHLCDFEKYVPSGEKVGFNGR